jgi:hypothetical protein
MGLCLIGDGNCEITKLNNLNFMTCKDNSESNNQKQFFIAFSLSRLNNTVIRIENSSCMEKIKNHFYTKKETTEIKSYDPKSKKWSKE